MNTKILILILLLPVFLLETYGQTKLVAGKGVKVKDSAGVYIITADTGNNVQELLGNIHTVNAFSTLELTPSRLLGENYQLPADEFIRLDTIHGVVVTIDSKFQPQYLDGFKVVEVYKTFFDKAHDPNIITKIAPGMYSSTAMAIHYTTESTEIQKVKNIYGLVVMPRDIASDLTPAARKMLGMGEFKTHIRKDIDLNKWYEFIPESQFQ